MGRYTTKVEIVLDADGFYPVRIVSPILRSYEEGAAFERGFLAKDLYELLARLRWSKKFDEHSKWK